MVAAVIFTSGFWKRFINLSHGEVSASGVGVTCPVVSYVTGGSVVLVVKVVLVGTVVLMVAVVLVVLAGLAQAPTNSRATKTQAK